MPCRMMARPPERGKSSAVCSGKVLGAMVAGMDARHDDLIHTIVQALMNARYAPPRRRRPAWHEGYDEDLQQARRVAVAVLDALQATGYRISRTPPAPPHHAP
jgi:hypothetical protein